MNNILHIRTQLGLSQAAMGGLMGVTQGNVGHYENRGQEVPPDAARRLIAGARRLGYLVTFNDIYGRAGRIERIKPRAKAVPSRLSAQP